ncbi:MAG: CPBP family intramembrane glutamic endopeptidase [Candidatus Hodarchaeota archaeon]
MLTLLLKKYNEKAAIIINTVLFALAHLVNLFVSSGLDLTTALTLMAGQLLFVAIGTPLLALLFVKSKSLIPGIVVHYTNDAFYPFLVSYMQPGPDLVRAGLYMLTGWLVGNIVAILCVLWLTKRWSLVPPNHMEEVAV